jgi:hypothetical protein
MRPALWMAAAGILLVPLALALLRPAQSPESLAATQPAVSPATARPDPDPVPVTPSADPPPPAASQAQASALPAIELQGEQTLYLTIVGDKVYRQMGPVSGRPPRIDQLTMSVDRHSSPATDQGGGVPVQPGAGFVIADYEQPAPPLNAGEPPLGPAPQECPRTLPAGSDQAMADSLRRQSGCRYLSSCSVDNECTFFYQGRG